jgi:hypothetical protein
LSEPCSVKDLEGAVLVYIVNHVLKALHLLLQSVCLEGALVKLKVEPLLEYNECNVVVLKSSILPIQFDKVLESKPILIHEVRSYLVGRLEIVLELGFEAPVHVHYLGQDLLIVNEILELSMLFIFFLVCHLSKVYLVEEPL